MLFLTCVVKELFTTCSWVLRNLFSSCSFLVHNLFMTCSWLVHDLLMISKYQLVYNLFITFRWRVQDLLMTCLGLADRNYHSCQKSFDKNHALFPRIEIIWQECFQCVSRVFQDCFRRVSRVFQASFPHKGFINEQKYVDCNAISLFKTSLILVAMWKNPVLLQKVL